MTTEHDTKLFIDKLASSGLDENDAEILGMEYLSPAETKTLLSYGDACPALHIPYFHPLTNIPMRFVPKYEPFFRVRYLGKMLPLDKDGKPKRYIQGTKGVCAYFPKNQDWPAIFGDPSAKVFITEGELKAAKACKEGLPTIGLGGVDNFQTSKYFVEFLPELEEINWIERPVYIVFDSDAVGNDSITGAVNRLVRQLADRGALPFFFSLPGIPGLTKTGLDDYLVKYPVQRFHSEVMSTAMHLTAAEKLLELNKRYIVINNPPCVYDKILHQPLDFTHFTRLHSQKTQVFVLPSIGRKSRKVERVHLGTAWLEWSARMRADKVVNAPEGPEIILDVNSNGVEIRQYNGWCGWGCSPAKGDTKPFHELFEFLTESLTKEQRLWLLQWFAYPLQNPKNNKMATAVIMYGETQGTGKSLLGTTIKKIYGQSSGVISASILSSGFNGWLPGKMFIACDEMVSPSRWSFSETMKSYVTEPEILVNQKHVKPYLADNKANFYFTTNNIGAVHLDLNDRRYFVCEAKRKPLLQSFYSEYGKWLECGGAGALFHYLRSEVSLTKFMPMASAPVTEVKTEMTIAASSDVVLWLQDIFENGKHLQISDIGDLVSTSHLRMIYNDGAINKLGLGAFGAACRQAGLRPVCSGQRLQTKQRGKSIFYPVKNADKWLQASRKDVVKYINSFKVEYANDKRY